VKPLRDCRLYTFLDTAYLRGRAPSELVRQLCDGGSDIIQLRAKGAAPEDLRRLGAEIWPIVRSAGVGLVINDHLKLAQELGAPLCHLGQEDFFEAGYAHVSQLPTANGTSRTHSPRIQIGLSTHSPTQAQRALDAGADYIAIGPVYATPTKPTARAVTLDYVRWAAAHITIPWFAIGGINRRNLDEVLDAGARRICVVSAILTADDVAEACQEFKDRLMSAGRKLPS
jgi:thiamine-phosphate pyrophosphorylase